MEPAANRRKLCAILHPMDRLAQRFAEADQKARARATLLRSRLPLAVELLRARGADRVWLFGSLTSDGQPHGESDVDMVVAGLSPHGLIRVLLDVEAILGARVDLTRLEEASASLRRRIEAEGELLHVPR